MELPSVKNLDLARIRESLEESTHHEGNFRNFTYWRGTAAAMLIALEDAQAKLKLAEDALGIYAEPGFWEFGKAKPEGGWIARTALAELRKA